MGPGLSWTVEEAADLARAWIGTSEDLIIGVYQTFQQFSKAMFERFGSYAPEEVNGIKYRSRGLRSTRAKWDSISADCQTFGTCLRFIRYNPTGVKEYHI